ncbi:MAG: hypothetical protein M0P10_03345 [Sphaerochaetaceae bacterium]|nr:hypothetical protein [Sphaerochaetaceae bacterium]
MKKIFKKRIISLIILSVVIAGSIFAKTSIALSAGSINNIFFYDKNGVYLKNVNQSYIAVDDTLIIKTRNDKSVFTYKFGNIIVDKDSIFVINENNSEFTFYLVDGTAQISSRSETAANIKILTPVTSYTLNGVGDIKVITTDEKEAFELNKGSAIVYNGLTGKTYSVHENNKMNLDTPKLIAYNELDKLNSRNAFINSTFPYGVKAISKSDDSSEQYTLNIIATGNGEGNVNMLNFATFKGILDAADKDNEKYMLIDAGNTLSGSVAVNQDKGKTATALLDKIGYDVFVPGSFDFAYGSNRLKELDLNSNVNFVSTNTLDKDNYNIFSPYALYQYNDFRIAVFGLSSPSDLSQLEDISFKSDVLLNNAQNAIDTAHQYADLVVLVSNYNDETITSKFIAENLNGIDLIIDGSKSLAAIYKTNDTYITTTGVGYDKIIDVNVNVYKDNIISIIPTIVHSSNIEVGTSNRLAEAFKITDWKDNADVEEYLSSIKIDSSLSPYLISPNIDNIDYDIETNIPMKPQFTKIVVRKSKTESIPTIANILATGSKDIATEEVLSSDMASTQSDMMDSAHNSNMEKADSTNKENNFGLLTTLEGSYYPDDFSFSSQKFNTKVTLNPYFRTDNFDIALNFEAELVDVVGSTFPDDIEYSFYPLPDSSTSTSETWMYYFGLIKTFKFNINDIIEVDIDETEIDSPIQSALVYRTIGDDDTLSLTSNISVGSLTSYAFVSDMTLNSVFDGDGDSLESAGFIPTISLFNDSLTMNVGAFATLTDNKEINIYPVISDTVKFIDKGNKELSFNANGTLYIPAYPNLDLTSVFDTSTTSVPNYLVGGSLYYKHSKVSLRIGADYLVYESGNDDLSVDMIHSQFIKSDLFDQLSSNTISPFVDFEYKSDNASAYVSYMYSYDLDTSAYDTDRLDTEFEFGNDNLSLDLYYIQEDVISNIQNFTDIKDYLYNSQTEFGASVEWMMTSAIESTATVGVLSDSTVPLYLQVQFSFDLGKAF